MDWFLYFFADEVNYYGYYVARYGGYALACYGTLIGYSLIAPALRSVLTVVNTTLRWTITFGVAALVIFSDAFSSIIEVVF